MLKRLRYLKEAIGGLLATDELVTCNFPTEAQWANLKEIENALCIPAEVQRQLEGEQHVTSSFVPLALHNIRQSYVSILNDEVTSGPVKELMKKMLDDLDKRRKSSLINMWYEEEEAIAIFICISTCSMLLLLIQGLRIH